MADKIYRVTFTYTDPVQIDHDGAELREQSATIRAPSPDRAAVSAFLQGKLPMMFIDEEPIYWSPSHAEDLLGEAWPTVVDENILAWGDEDRTGTLLFSVEEEVLDPSAAR